MIYHIANIPVEKKKPRIFMQGFEHSLMDLLLTSSFHQFFRICCPVCVMYRQLSQHLFPAFHFLPFSLN